MLSRDLEKKTSWSSTEKKLCDVRPGLIDKDMEMVDCFLQCPLSQSLGLRPAPSVPPFSLPPEVDCCVSGAHCVGMAPIGDDA